MQVAIYQMEIVPGKPEENREKVKRWVSNLEGDRPLTIVLPELWTTGYTLPIFEQIADEDYEPTRQFLKQLAQDYNVNIVGGSYANRREGKMYNSSIVINARGEVVHYYEKIHMVPMLNEHLYLTGGNRKTEIFELNGIKCGLIICYDLRFTEIIRPLALKGVEVLFVVAEWPTSRLTHWNILQYARAIENQFFVVSCNNVGEHEQVEYGGNSKVIDPWGNTIISGEKIEQTLMAQLNISEVKEIREKVPVFKSRVPHLYR